MASYVRKFRCGKCKTGFSAFVGEKSKWVQCPRCNHMIKVKSHG